MTAKQTRQRNLLATILSAALGVLALAALFVILVGQEASAHPGTKTCRWVDAIPEPYKVCTTVHDASEHPPPPPPPNTLAPPPTAAPTTAAVIKPPDKKPPAQDDPTNHNDDGTCSPRCADPSDLGHGNPRPPPPG